jgi:transposase
MSERVHRGYDRRLADNSAGGHEVLILLSVRRFFCDRQLCPKKTFAEQIDGVSTPYGRHTTLAQQLLQAVALALGGRPGARLSLQLAVPVNRMTLLRVIRKIPDPPIVTPAVIGVDEFAKRRGHKYATILVDMHSHRPIDVFDDRTADDLAAWLQAHPGVEVVCRDRASGYSEGATRGAPDAIQCADRWHLLHNLSGAVEKAVARHRHQLRPSTSEQVTLTEPQMASTALAVRTTVRHRDVHALWAKGFTVPQIARKLHLDAKTVRRYVDAPYAQDLISARPGRSSRLDSHKPYLLARCTEGISGTAILLEEIRGRGYRGGERTLRRWLIAVRGTQPPPAPPKIPSARAITAWIMRPYGKLNEVDRLGFKEVQAKSEGIAAIAALARGFTNMVRQRGGEQLQCWLTEADQAGIPELRSFATGLGKDFDAVRNGLMLAYSSGAVEGAITRVKAIKRQMYGRANLDLLRKRILLKS